MYYYMGGAKGMLAHPLKLLGGLPPPPPPPPAPLSSYAYDYVHCLQPIYTMFQVSTTTNLMFTDNTLILHPKISLYTAYSGYKEKLEGTWKGYTAYPHKGTIRHIPSVKNMYIAFNLFMKFLKIIYIFYKSKTLDARNNRPGFWGILYMMVQVGTITYLMIKDSIIILQLKTSGCTRYKGKV